MKLGYTIFYVENVEKTICFYEKAFSLNRKFVTLENDYGELDTGQTCLAFVSLEFGQTNFRNALKPIDKLSAPISLI